MHVSRTSGAMPYQAIDGERPCEESSVPFESILKELFTMIEQTEHRAAHTVQVIAHAEKLWNDTLLEKIAEEQKNLSSIIARNKNISTVSDIIAPLALAGQGFASLFVRISPQAIASIALGGILALDAACGSGLKNYLASFLARASGEDQQRWAERISCTCAISSTVLGLSLPLNNVTEIATTVSRSVAEGMGAFSTYSTNRQKAVLLEVDNQKDQSARNMRFYTDQMALHQSATYDCMRQLASLHQSQISAIEQIFNT